MFFQRSVLLLTVFGSALADSVMPTTETSTLAKRSALHANQYIQGWRSVSTSFSSCTRTIESSSSSDYHVAYRSVTKLYRRVTNAIQQYQSCDDCDHQGMNYGNQYSQTIGTCISEFQHILEICKTRYAQYWQQYFASIFVKFQSFFNYAQQSCGYFGIQPSSLFANAHVDSNLLGSAGIRLSIGAGLGLGLGGNGNGNGRAGGRGGFGIGAGVGAGLGLGGGRF